MIKLDDTFDIQMWGVETTGCGFCGCIYSPSIEYRAEQAILHMKCPKCGSNDFTKERELINGELPLINISS